MRGKNPHDPRRSAILGRREEALPPAAPRPMRRIVMRALSSSASVSREKGPGGRRGGANAIRNGERSRYKGPRLSVAAPPADRSRTAIRLSPHVPADPYTVVRQNPSTDQRSRNCPSHERFYPHCVRSPSTPAAKQARSIRRQRRTGDFSARKIQKSEFVRLRPAHRPEPLSVRPPLQGRGEPPASPWRCRINFKKTIAPRSAVAPPPVPAIIGHGPSRTPFVETVRARTIQGDRPAAILETDTATHTAPGWEENAESRGDEDERRKTASAPLYSIP